MVKLSELQSGQGKVDIEVSVKSKAETRTFNKYGKDLRVCNAIVSDGESDMVLSLWNEDIEKVNVGDKLKVINGYVSEFNGTKQLGAGKFGKLEVVGAGNVGKTESKPAKSAKSKKEVEIEEQEF